MAVTKTRVQGKRTGKSRTGEKTQPKEKLRKQRRRLDCEDRNNPRRDVIAYPPPGGADSQIDSDREKAIRKLLDDIAAVCEASRPRGTECVGAPGCPSGDCTLIHDVSVDKIDMTKALIGGDTFWVASFKGDVNHRCKCI